MKAVNTVLRLLAVLGFALSATMAQAVVTPVDTFADTGPMISADGSPASDTIFENGLSNAIGGSRYRTVEYASGSGAVVSVVASGLYQLYTTAVTGAPPTDGRGILEYNAFSGLNLDLTIYDLAQSFLDIVVFGASGSTAITLTMYNAQGAHIIGTTPVDSATTVSFSLSGLATAAYPLIFSEIYLEFDLAAGGSIVVDSMSLRLAESIPEPATLALFGLGLAGIPFVRRRRTPA